MNNYIVRSYRDVIVITKFAITKFAITKFAIRYADLGRLILYFY